MIYICGYCKASIDRDHQCSWKGHDGAHYCTLRCARMAAMPPERAKVIDPQVSNRGLSAYKQHQRGLI
jgi:hypothetical protein